MKEKRRLPSDEEPRFHRTIRSSKRSGGTDADLEARIERSRTRERLQERRGNLMRGGTSLTARKREVGRYGREQWRKAEDQMTMDLGVELREMGQVASLNGRRRYFLRGWITRWGKIVQDLKFPPAVPVLPRVYVRERRASDIDIGIESARRTWFRNRSIKNASVVLEPTALQREGSRTRHNIPFNGPWTAPAPFLNGGALSRA